jgi:DNA-binding transcriptional LysR family regulator
MDIHQLRIFLSVFRNRSFTKAAGELCLTQPTISDHIKALEEDLSCRLFDRLGRTIIPTREAEVLYDHAVEILEKADSVKGVLSQFQKEITGELVIGASTIPGTYVIPSLIAEFRQQHPSLSFEVLISDSREIIEKVLKHELLVGISGSKFVNTQISCIPFMEDELIVVSSPSFMTKYSIPVRDLLKYPMILREEGSGTRRESEKILEGKGISLEDIRAACVLGSTDAVKQAVKARLGIAIVSKLSVTDELACGTLKEIRLTDTRMKRQFYIVTHKQRSLPLAYSVFLKFLKARQ